MRTEKLSQRQEGFAIAFSRQQKKDSISAVLFFVGRGDGITRSYLCLYVRFRLFNAFVVVYAFSFGSSGLHRFAIQTCAPCLLKQEGFAIAFSRQQKKDSISAVLFLLVEVTVSLAHICACMRGFVCLTRLWSYMLFRLARQVCIALRYKLAHPAC